MRRWSTVGYRAAESEKNNTYPNNEICLLKMGENLDSGNYRQGITNGMEMECLVASSQWIQK